MAVVGIAVGVAAYAIAVLLAVVNAAGIGIVAGFQLAVGAGTACTNEKNRKKEENMSKSHR